MRIAFIDLVSIDYTPATPLQRPLGGMQSALCYLAAELVRRGHDVIIFNNTSAPDTYSGIRTINIHQGAYVDDFESIDVVISITAAARDIRALGFRCPLLLWTGHNTEKSAIQIMHDRSESTAWDAIVMVSKWQAKRYAKGFSIAREKLHVVPNAISPRFETSPVRSSFYFEGGCAPTLVYSSTPYRGLDVLLRAFPKIRAQVPGCTARIFSSLSVYGVEAGQDQFTQLYDRCRRTEGMEYHGSVSQSALAEAYGSADIFAYPCIFRETSCISLMEAMASGCEIMTTNVGALSETAAGFGHMCDYSAGVSNETFADIYADYVARTVSESRASPAAQKTKLRKQQQFAQQTYAWSTVAREWEKLLASVLRRRRLSLR